MPAVAAIAMVAASAYAANRQSSAAKKASNIQQQSADQGIDETRRQFDVATSEQRQRFEQLQKLLSPFVTAGTGALTEQQNMLGLNGDPAQQAIMESLEGSPMFTGLVKQGEDAILANASATGGLRGGNVQAALAQFRPQMLAQMFEDRYGKLAGLSSLGQNAAAFTGNAGVNTGAGIAQNAMLTGANISNLLGQKGAAAAGGALAQGKAQAGYANAISQGIGTYFGGGMGGGKF